MYKQHEKSQMKTKSEDDSRWTDRLKRLKREGYIIYLCYRDPRVPWYAKATAALVVAYAFSPIDLIPDFIPVLGYLDDVILIPLGITLVLKMIPAEVHDEYAVKAEKILTERPKSRLMPIVILVIWAVILFLVAVSIVSWGRAVFEGRG